MPSNRELKQEIEALTVKLDAFPCPDLQRLNQSELIALLNDLREKEAELAPSSTTSFVGAVRATVPRPDGPVAIETSDLAYEPAPKEEHRAPVEPQSHTTAELELARTQTRYVVASGKALTSNRGVLGPGTRVRLFDFAGGEKQIALLAQRGYLIEVT